MVLFAHYPFNQTAGPTIPDVSGNARHGTQVGTVSFTAGQIGNALNLNGATGNYVDLPDGMLSTVNDVTFAVWVRVRTDRNWQRIFDFGASTTVNMFLTSHASMTGVNAVRFAITINGNAMEQQLTGAGVLPVGVWTHVAVGDRPHGGHLVRQRRVGGTNTMMTLRPSMLGTTANNWIGRRSTPTRTSTASWTNSESTTERCQRRRSPRCTTCGEGDGDG